MARSIGVVTQLQQNQPLFKKLIGEIKQATPQRLRLYNLVSDVTIYKYIKGEACAPGVEEAILESLGQYKAERQKTESDNEKRAEALLTA